MAKGDRLYTIAMKEAAQKSPDYELVLDKLQAAIDLGSNKATYTIANWMLHGKILKKDVSTAVEFLEIASEEIAEAAYDLAICYEKGIGVKMNPKRAFLLYLKAALMQDIDAIESVGRCYYYGIGVSKNAVIAEVWLKRVVQLQDKA